MNRSFIKSIMLVLSLGFVSHMTVAGGTSAQTNKLTQALDGVFTSQNSVKSVAVSKLSQKKHTQLSYYYPAYRKVWTCIARSANYRSGYYRNWHLGYAQRAAYNRCVLNGGYACRIVRCY